MNEIFLNSGAVTKVSETKASKRAKVRRGVVWYAKKTKMLENLEAAFPSCINTQQLLRWARTNSLVKLLKLLTTK